MKNNFEISYEHMKKCEGGLQLHRNPTESSDTYAGIYRRYHSDWEGWSYIDQEETPPESLVISFYKEKFWDKVRGDDLPNGLDLCVFDFAVNSAPTDAIQVLQYLVGAKSDGIIGNNTLTKVDAYVSRSWLEAGKAVLDYNSDRIDHMMACDEDDLLLYDKGWARRVLSTSSVASNLVLPF